MVPIITNIKQLDLKGSYTYADYLLWQFKDRVELIKGKIFKMSPAPSRSHQEISWVLARQLDKVFHKTSCKMYSAPFDVRLINFKDSTDDNQITSVVQPDLCVVCDTNKLDEKGCVGAPDLIIEILSPGNSNREMTIKFDLYEENGVKEYWIVNQSEKTILIYVLKENKFIGLKPIVESGKLESPTFPSLKFSVKNIFKE
ncbi:Uma2 family endonuclease [Flavobacterium nackdongense]|uniref:Uma2 family endonuclease n=1 Tax=Flavobacterium nackdongense TaxID=2547394 RepID=A0A4P6YGK2_9FLAO|nr:Uma2 family endonuclease [Flavobacterium nackdongense]QBN19947.1 Uma2 family endonuclease [Flavobacterium nackdongense]